MGCAAEISAFSTELAFIPEQVEPVLTTVGHAARKSLRCRQPSQHFAQRERPAPAPAGHEAVSRTRFTMSEGADLVDQTRDKAWVLTELNKPFKYIGRRARATTRRACVLRRR